jgi:hypothetical protein
MQGFVMQRINYAGTCSRADAAYGFADRGVDGASCSSSGCDNLARTSLNVERV